MADFETLLERDRSFAERFLGRELNIRPRLPTVILVDDVETGAIDRRVPPARLRATT